MKPLSVEQMLENKRKRNSILYIKLAGLFCVGGLMVAFAVSLLAASLVFDQNALQELLLAKKRLFLVFLLVLAAPLAWKNLK
jgi:hypothetical protein